MNKLGIFLLFTLCFESVFAQTILETATGKVTTEESKKLKEYFNNYEIITINTIPFNKNLKNTKAIVKTVLNINSELKWDITLEENEIRGPGFKAVVTTDSGEIVEPLTKCNTYKGFVDNDPEQYIRLYIDDEHFEGLVFDKKRGHYIINKVNTVLHNKLKDNRYIVYKLTDVNSELSRECGTEPLSETIKKSLRVARTDVITSCRVLEVATEADNEYSALYGTATNPIMMISMNAVDGIYSSTFNTRIMVNYQNAWVTTDPYSSTSNHLDLLNEFKNYWNTNRTSVKRDWAHLYTNRTMGNVVGVAYTGSICQNPNSSYGLSREYFPVDVSTAHEMGHGFGAEHPTDPASNCVGTNRTIMCASDANTLIFSASSQSDISNYMQVVSLFYNCLNSLENFAMSGPEIVCLTATFTTNSSTIPVTWTSSNNSILTINSSGFAQKVGSSSGQVLITATLNVCGSNISVTKFIYVGIPPTPSLSITGVAPYGAVDVNTTNAMYGTYNWYRDNSFIQSTSSSWGTLNGGSCGTNHNMTVEISNTCGTSPQSSPSFYSFPCSFMVVYPNPANEVLTFDFGATENTTSLPNEIRLYNEKSNIVRSFIPETAIKNDGNKVQLDVKDLPRGIYYLHSIPKNESEKEIEIVRILLQ